MNELKFPLWTEFCSNNDIKKHPYNKIKIELWG